MLGMMFCNIFSRRILSRIWETFINQVPIIVQHQSLEVPILYGLNVEIVRTVQEQWTYGIEVCQGLVAGKDE